MCLYFILVHTSCALNSRGCDGAAGFFPLVNILRENDMYGMCVSKLVLLHNETNMSLECVSRKEYILIMPGMYKHVFDICKGHGSKLIFHLTLQTVSRLSLQVCVCLNVLTGIRSRRASKSRWKWLKSLVDKFVYWSQIISSGRMNFPDVQK